MDFETCYVFKGAGSNASRPSKRRRIEPPRGLHSSWPARQAVYKHLWSEQEQRLKDLRLDINTATITQIVNFVQKSPLDTSTAKVPAALILTGPSIASHALLFDQLSHAVTQSCDKIFVTLTSAIAPNLKTLLKHLIQKATSANLSQGDSDDEEIVKPKGQRGRLLPYDLRLLHDHLRKNGGSRVVIAFQDCEAFEGQLLSETIELLHCWKDRIPFVFLFGVATSIQDFQAKLSKRATRCIQGRRFDVVKAELALEQAFSTIHGSDTTVWVGPGLCDTILKRQRDHIQSLDAFIDSIHYGLLSHFYANALTIFLDPKLSISDIPADHFEALRQLPSFQSHVQSILEERDTTLARALLDDDERLFQYLKIHLAEGVSALWKLSQAAQALHTLQTSLETGSQSALSSVKVDALRGELRDSPWLRTILLRLRKSNSSDFKQLLNRLKSATNDDLLEACDKALIELDELLETRPSGDGPLRSAEDVQNSTLRTTVIAKKVELSKQKSALTKQDTAYSALLHRFTSHLEDHLDNALIDPKSLPFNEIFLYDLRSPLRDVFTPKPRFAVERALAAPHDYLDCTCCAPNNAEAASRDENTLAATQPATAVLYQLYLESGAMINAADLRTAFFAIMDPDEVDEVQTSALFQRALAELKYLGLVRGTRKKVDHILKMSWKGL